MSCALINKKNYEYCNFIEGQAYRDGTTLLETMIKYDFKIKYLDTPCFIHRRHDINLTNNKNIDSYDKKIKEHING